MNEVKMKGKWYKFLVDTSNCCFLCLKEIKSKNDKVYDRESEVKDELQTFSLQKLFHHLKLNLSQINALSKKSPHILRRTEVRVGLCLGCQHKMEQFSKLYSEMELLKLKLECSLEQIQSCLESSKRNSNILEEYQDKILQSQRALKHSNIVEELREQLLTKCSYINPNFWPRINLEKLNAEDYVRTTPPRQNDESCDPANDPNEDNNDPVPSSSPCPSGFDDNDDGVDTNDDGNNITDFIPESISQKIIKQERFEEEYSISKIPLEHENDDHSDGYNDDIADSEGFSRNANEDIEISTKTNDSKFYPKVKMEAEAETSKLSSFSSYPKRKRGRPKRDKVKPIAKPKVFKKRNTKFFYCEICDYRCQTQISLDLHMDIHKPPDEKKYEGNKCYHCGKVYLSIDRLKLHLKTHSDVKPHKCKICSKRFLQRQVLNHHMDAHARRAGEVTDHMLKYKCKICSKLISNAYGMQVHLRTHTKEAPFKCDQCGKAFRDKCNLNRHISTHEGIRYQCEHCEKSFTRKDILKRHFDLEHSTDPPDELLELPPGFNGTTDKAKESVSE